MKKNKFYAVALAIAMSAGTATYAQDCQMQMASVVDEAFSGIPIASQGMLEMALDRIITQNGMTKDITFAQFVLTAKVEVLDKHIVTGGVAQYVNNLGVTLYVGDNISKQLYASTYIEVNGVGKSEEKSFNNAIQNMRPQNRNIAIFMEGAKNKIINYYDKYYPQIIKEAQTKANFKAYEEALALICTVPVCSKGYDQAMKAGLVIYNKYRDRYGSLLLNQAKALWAQNPTDGGAMDVAELIGQIDPEAACHREAMQFLQTVQKQTRSDIEYEVRKKYEDRVSLEKSRIEAIKAIGMAYGQNQPKTTVAFLTPAYGAGAVVAP